MDFLAGLIQRPEEAQALNVIHVKVSQEHVHTPGLRAQGRTETSDPRAGIEDEHSTVGPAHLDARRIPPVPVRLGPRGGK
jgi:hypothetical protein